MHLRYAAWRHETRRRQNDVWRCVAVSGRRWYPLCQEEAELGRDLFSGHEAFKPSEVIDDGGPEEDRDSEWREEEGKCFTKLSWNAR